MNERALAHLYEAAARATINERCAPAYLHDLRGSLQALFGAFELLGRSARSAGADPARVEKACDLARRAIDRHGKSMMEALQVLTAASAPACVDLAGLMRDVAHFLRNDAATRAVTVAVAGPEEMLVWADRSTLQTVLSGLLAAAIDETPAGSEVTVEGRVNDSEAEVSIGSADAHEPLSPEPLSPEPRQPPPEGRMSGGELTRVFARHFLAANGGRLTVANGLQRGGSVTLVYPLHGRR